MKFSKSSGQLLLVALIGLVVASLLSACQLVTIDYLYVAGTYSNTQGTNGAIQVFAVDSQSGAIRFAAGTEKTPFLTGGQTPVAMAVSSDEANLYVAVADNNTVVHYTIASNGVLTKKDSVTLADPPTALAVNQANSFLYVLSGTTTSTLTAYSIKGGAIGSATEQHQLIIPGYAGDVTVPTAVAVLPNNSAVFASVYDQSSYNPGGTITSAAHPGWVFSFGADSSGALTPANGNAFQAGVKPTGVAVDPTNRFVYVTDYASNQLIGYGITDNTKLNFLISGPYKTGAEPSAVTVDPRGKYIYVSNSLDSTVSAYAIDLATGIPSIVINTTGSQLNASDTQPVAVAVDPALGRYVYTSNFLGNSVSGFRLNPNTGALAQTQATPYPSLSKPRAIAIISHGNHSLQNTTP
ncbi:beta-propeller fold lactonase family protein [Occallatibacter riparius]|uniref:Beta-propeller fold lactonase family protein n=1 Tax=Occallatibacter riparius TaxID=1002689 RepID=A0A9J7BVH7_9BACT|nr:beta-propeller fold lactonase family protein [Occallatibacter riparius]UWZ86632.1 beta-propeller fold lactonase family protein [Occallatibacter riparius]